MFEALFHFFNGPSPIHPKIWKGRLAPMQFRVYQDSDFQRCIEIYRANEPGRFPANAIEEYEQLLRTHSSYLLVGERDGKVVCTGGIHRIEMKDWAVLCFGLVDPQFQNQGIGTALVLARLALLDREIPTHLVFILPVTKSIEFYRRMGFQDAQSWQDKNGDKHPSATLVFNYHDIRRAEKILQSNNITIPERPKQLPTMHFKPQEQ